MAKVMNFKERVLKKGGHWLTSDFGNRTYTNSKGQKVSGFHKGIDLVGANSTLDYIVAFAAGKVAAAGYDSSSMGNYVKIDHGNGYVTRYMHMKNKPTLKKGDTVAKGQELGYMGSTGNSTGAHLHFDICKSGTYVDPKPYLTGEKSFTEKAAATVKEWQLAAIADGFEFPKAGADGKWGNECRAVVKKTVCKRRSENKYPNLNKLVQRVVGVETDGKFGPATESAVKKYQSSNGLEPDGSCGPATWKKILNVD